MFRIFPALFVIVTITVVVIGPAVTSLSVAGYWRASETWQYFINFVLLAQYELPEVFTAHPQTAVNGSLWSLGVEFSCYLMLILTALVGARARTTVRALLLAGVLIAVFYVPLTGANRTTAYAVSFFLVGSLLAKGTRVRQLPGWPALVGLVAVGLLGDRMGQPGMLLTIPVISYAVVAIGGRSSEVATRVRKLGDPSYGMYLWGFLVQQLYIQCFGLQPLLQNILVVLPLTMMLGYASWWACERWAIRTGALLAQRTVNRPAQRALN